MSREWTWMGFEVSPKDTGGYCYTHYLSFLQRQHWKMHWKHFSHWEEQCEEQALRFIRKTCLSFLINHSELSKIVYQSFVRWHNQAGRTWLYGNLLSIRGLEDLCVDKKDWKVLSEVVLATLLSFLGSLQGSHCSLLSRLMVSAKMSSETFGECFQRREGHF